jgi:hypothetical protein
MLATLREIAEGRLTLAENPEELIREVPGFPDTLLAAMREVMGATVAAQRDHAQRILSLVTGTPRPGQL